MSRAALPDVNVLLALAWPNHQFHGHAHRWFGAESPRRWHTCSLTQAGFVRLSSNPAWTPHALGTRDAVVALRRMLGQGEHTFLSESVSFEGSPFDALAPRLQGHRQVTDALLLATAEHHGAELVTLDRRLADLSPFEARPRLLGPGGEPR